MGQRWRAGGFCMHACLGTFAWPGSRRSPTTLKGGKRNSNGDHSEDEGWVGGWMNGWMECGWRIPKYLTGNFACALGAEGFLPPSYIYYVQNLESPRLLYIGST